jgi:hypothetical protein
LFSFVIDIFNDEGEGASYSLALGIASAEIKSKLEDLLGLLQEDTTQLVDDSDPAKSIFKTLRGQILDDALPSCPPRESPAPVPKSCSTPC